MRRDNHRGTTGRSEIVAREILEFSNKISIQIISCLNITYWNLEERLSRADVHGAGWTRFFVLWTAVEETIIKTLGFAPLILHRSVSGLVSEFVLCSGVLIDTR